MLLTSSPDTQAHLAGAAAVLLLGPLQLETLHRVSLALLLFYAGLRTDLRRIRGMEELLVALRHGVRGPLVHLLQFEAALTTVMALLGFGFASAILQGQAHGGNEALQAALANRLPEQLSELALHVLAGLVAGVAVGGLAPRLIDWLVRSVQQLLLVAIALAFVAYGFGQLLGGVMQPFNTAAEFTVLLLLGLIVKPEALVAVLPLNRSPSSSRP